MRRLLFGRGAVVEPLRSELASEGIRFLAEGLRGSITYYRYRGPGLRGERLWTTWQRDIITGGIALTSRRFVLIVRNGKHADIPFGHPLFSSVDISCDRPDRIVFGYESGVFRPDRRGRVEVRLLTDQAAEICGVTERSRTGFDGPGERFG